MKERLMNYFASMSTSFLALGMSCVTILTVFSPSAFAVVGSGATIVSARDYPSLCRVLVTIDAPGRPEGEKAQALCSGVLVNPNEVVTAAHCFQGVSYGLSVSCGGKAAGPLEMSDVTYPDQKTWASPDHPSPAIDVAKIKLKTAFAKTSIELFTVSKSEGDFFENSGNLKKGVSCQVAGYGVNPHNGGGVLSMASLDALQTTWGNDRVIRSSFDDGNYLPTSVDEGDSGGALFCKTQANSAPVLVGIIGGARVENGDPEKKVEDYFAPTFGNL